MKKEKISFIGFLTASIIYFIGSILNFIDKDNGTAIMFLCLGLSFLCLATTHLDKNKKEK
jgi:cell division protein FtsW (lipid II flippase)